MDVLIAGRYRRIRRIGEGGGGDVWLAEDELLHREVAVKELRALPGEDATGLARGLREARSAAALQHPAVVAVYDVLEEPPAIVMEYVDGSSLAGLLAAEGPLDPARTAALLHPVAAALAAAHDAGIVHRDIKPANVLVAASGDAKLADFGVARQEGDPNLTRSGFTSGTAPFFSPEIAVGAEPTPASDVWAFGVTLYECVEGRRPHGVSQNSLQVLSAVANQPPQPPLQAGGLASLLAAMLARNPGERPDMHTVSAALADVAHGRAPVLPAAPSPWAAPEPARAGEPGTEILPVLAGATPLSRGRRRWGIVIGLGAALLCAAIAGGTALRGQDDGDDVVTVPVSSTTVPTEATPGSTGAPVSGAWASDPAAAVPTTTPAVVEPAPAPRPEATRAPEPQDPTPAPPAPVPGNNNPPGQGKDKAPGQTKGKNPKG